jgi:hypothetical protein
MVGANFEDDRSAEPTNAKTDTRFFNLVCRHKLHTM